MKTEELTAQSIEYSRTIVPSTMRSPYWKYFGFPSDNANNILTKQKIICTLCNTAIAYNKNTSNLRTHIMARHCELLHELQQQQQHNGIGSSNSSSSSGIISNSRKRPHSELAAALTLPTDDTINPDDSYITPDYKRHASLIVEEQDLVELVEGSSTDAATITNNTTDTLDYDDYTTTLEPTSAVDEEEEEESDQQNQQKTSEVLLGSSYSFANIGSSSHQKFNDTNSSELNDLTVDMLIKDVMPLSTIDGIGFMRLFSQIGSVDKPAVERKLNSLYDSMQQRITEYLEQFSQTNHYSLSIEINKNIDKFLVICIYVNYYSTEDNELLSVLYQTLVNSTTEDEVIDSHKIFKNFNLSNCAAVILNEENAHAELFFQTHDIPIIPCMECILRKCMRLFFDLPAVNDEFTKILKVTENAMKAENDLMITIPEVFVHCPWSKLNLMQFAHENLSFSNYDDAAEILKETRELIEYITPLKVTLDTIAEEPLTLCSLMRPLTLKLLEEHFATDFLGDSDYLTEVNRQLHQELINSILKNKFLNEATFFDARFRRDFLDANHIKTIKDAICVRFKPMLERAKHGDISRKIKVEHDTDHRRNTDNSSSSSSQRKSSLKSFFKRNAESTQKTTTATQKFSIDYEVNKYNCEPTLDLEQCPINWWHENSFNYKQLKQIADFYMNVPCCVNRLFRNGFNERNELQNKRSMLRNQYAQQIWYLHYNEKFYDKIRQTR